MYEHVLQLQTVEDGYNAGRGDAGRRGDREELTRKPETRVGVSGDADD
jgi:hypothetical protein